MVTKETGECALYSLRGFFGPSHETVTLFFPWLEDITRGREGDYKDFLRARGRTCASTVTLSGQSYLQRPINKNETSRQCVCVTC